MSEQAKKAPMTPTTLAYYIHEFADGEYNRRNRKAFMECIPEYRERVIAAAVEMFRDIHAEFAEVVKERDDLKDEVRDLRCTIIAAYHNLEGDHIGSAVACLEPSIRGVYQELFNEAQKADDLKKALGECLKICQALNKITVGPKGQAGVGKWVGNVMNLADDAAAIIPIAEKLLEVKDAT